MKNESLNNPFTWLVGFVAAVAIGAGGVNIDKPAEQETAQDVADYSATLADGDLVCRAAPMVAQGGAP